MTIEQKILNAIFSAIEKENNEEKLETIDKALLIKLTPIEIFNLIKLGATYWMRAKENNTYLTMDAVCAHHAIIVIELLKSTDLDRFEIIKP